MSHHTIEFGDSRTTPVSKQRRSVTSNRGSRGRGRGVSRATKKPIRVIDDYSSEIEGSEVPTIKSVIQDYTESSEEDCTPPPEPSLPNTSGSNSDSISVESDSPISPTHNDTTDEQANADGDVNEEEDVSIPVGHILSAHLEELTDFQVTRKRRIGKATILSLKKDGEVILQTVFIRKGKQRFFNIINPSTNYIHGSLKIQEYSRRFLLYGESNEELLGIYHLPQPLLQFAPRHFRLLIPKEGTMYVAPNKYANLSKLAKHDVTDDRFIKLATKLPIIEPDGSFNIKMGVPDAVDSNKNFLIRDHLRNRVFIIYKTAKDSFNLKIASPFGELTGFATAIGAIMGSTK